MNLQLRLTDRRSYMEIFELNKNTTDEYMQDVYLKYVIHFLNEIPAYQTIKRAKFRPPCAWIDMRCTNGDWQGVVDERAIFQMYTPGMDINHLGEMTKNCHRQDLALAEFLQSSFCIKG